MAEAEVGKRYRHYKGYEYTVLAIGRSEDTLEEQVVYRAEYTTEDFGPDAIWIRPRVLFEGTVNVDGRTVERFSRLD